MTTFMYMFVFNMTYKPTGLGQIVNSVHAIVIKLWKACHYDIRTETETVLYMYVGLVEW